jgi:serine/threonine protein kinase
MSHSEHDDGDGEHTEHALRRRPGDVSGQHETPDQFLSLESGETVGGRFTVRRYLGSSGGATSYLCDDGASGERAVLKLLELEAPESFLEPMRATIRDASRIRHRNLTSIIGMGSTESGDVFVAMEYVEGTTLSRSIAACREKGHEIGLGEGFHVLAHVSEALEAIHDETHHGVLTPYHVYLTDSGLPKVSNLGFGREVAALMQRRGRGGAFVDSIHVAPEARESPEALGPAADLYSLAMIAGELLAESGLPDQRDRAERAAVEYARARADTLGHLLESCLAHDPDARLSEAEQFRRSMETVLEDAGIDPSQPPPAEGLSIEPAIDDEDDPFDLPSLGTPDSSQGDEARYLVRRDGLDYGPFTEDELLEQLHDDEIDEHTEVRDRRTQESTELGDMEAIREEVEEYVELREERKRKERERREEIQRRVKQGGKAVLVAGIFAALGVLGVMTYVYMTRPAPEKVPLEKALVSMDYDFSPPPTDFQTVSADEDVLESIFNPDASKDAIARKVRRARGGGGGTAGSGSESGGAETIDMSETGGEGVRLTSRKINNIILSHFDALRDCILKERANDPSFEGVTVKFYIRPSGTTGGVGLRESQYENKPVGRCLIREFRTMKFPDPKAVTKRGVTFPLKVRR